MATIPLDVRREWAVLWSASTTEEQHRSRKVWSAQHLRLKPERTRWGRATGPLTRVIATLLDLAWVPIPPAYWVTDSKERVTLDAEGTSANTLGKLVHDSVQRRGWRKASAHVAGEGLQDGAGLTVPKRWLQNAAAKGLYEEVAAAKAALSAGMWTAQRKADAFHTDPVCPRCSKAPETYLHRYWQCECNEAILSAGVSSIKHLAPKAEGDTAHS